MEIENKKQFIKLFMSDEYILWLSSFMSKHNKIDDVFFIHGGGPSFDKEMIEYLKYLFAEINKYSIKNDTDYDIRFTYLLKYENYIYSIHYDGDGCLCKRYDFDVYLKEEYRLPYVEYEDLKKQFIKSMKLNFEFLKERVEDALEHTDLEYISKKLIKLKGPTILSGVGGSSVVSEFGTKVINIKNKIITVNSEPRDFIYHNFNNFNNVIACSYSGDNYGVDMSFSNNLKKYLLSNKACENKSVTSLTYSTKIAMEKSFISLGATLIPISILLNYYSNGNSEDVLNLIKEYEFHFTPIGDIYEIFSGYDTSTTSTYLESAMVESGIGIPIIHDKYSYCHGRSTLGINYLSNVIYLNRNTELDLLLIEEIKNHYRSIVIIDSKHKDQILDDYQMLIQAMYLTKYIAETKGKDLSKVEYSPIVKKLYKYKGAI